MIPSEPDAAYTAEGKSEYQPNFPLSPFVMELLVNGEKVVLDQTSSLLHYLEKSNLSEKKGIAVALNEKVISKNNWDKELLKNNDKILIITASQGG